MALRFDKSEAIGFYPMRSCGDYLVARLSGEVTFSELPCDGETLQQFFA